MPHGARGMTFETYNFGLDMVGNRVNKHECYGLTNPDKPNKG